MKVLDPGHIYALQELDHPPIRDHASAEELPRQQLLVFVKRQGPKYPGNHDAHPGTQIQEVCRALIDRLHYVDRQEHDDVNEMAIQNLREVIYLLENRAARKHKRLLQLSSIDAIEFLPTCPTCGHIGCEGACR